MVLFDRYIWKDCKLKSLIKDDTFNRVVIKIVNIQVWLFLYISFIWFLDYTSTIEKIIGFLTLALGIYIIFVPKRFLSIIALQYTSLLFVVGVIIVLTI